MEVESPDEDRKMQVNPTWVIEQLKPFAGPHDGIMKKS